MRIYVCVKQVPDTSGKVAVNPDGTLNRGSMATIINPDDMVAIEQALEIKDELGCKVTAVTMGPPQAENMLREILAMGADDAVLISSREFGGSDTFATSQIIAAAITHLGNFLWTSSNRWRYSSSWTTNCRKIKHTSSYLCSNN